MDTIGFRASAIVLVVCVVLALRFAGADTGESTEDELVFVAEAALIAEIFGDRQGDQDWSAVQPEFVLEVLPIDRLQLAVIDGISLQTGVQSTVANGEGQPYSSGASEDCE